MRYAIISDIHGNLEAFMHFLKLLPELKVEKIIFLGDLVGYNPNPNECIELISRFKSARYIRGNHDRVCIDKKYHDFSSHAVRAIRWTIGQLTPGSKKFLSAMDSGPALIDGLFLICHGSPLDEDEYILNAYETRPHFSWLKEQPVKILFFGHTHMQRIYYSKQGTSDVKISTHSKIKIVPDKLYLINPGSIGQPRDKNPNPGFALFDSQTMKVQLHRFSYPFDITAKKILYHKLPAILAQRLSGGF